MFKRLSLYLQAFVRCPAMALVLMLTPSLADAQTIPTTLGWSQIPSTKIADVCAATHGFPQVWGGSGCKAILNWSGGVFDTNRNRLIVWGGGHNDYYGNELYAFSLDDQKMTRLSDPGLPIGSGSSCQEAISNGEQANSRHTYDGIEYMPNVDRLFAFSGSLACAVGTFGAWTWTFDFTTMKWQNMNPAGPNPVANPGVLTAYDPNTGLIFVHDRRNLYSYNFNTNAYTRLSSQYLALGYHLMATIDPVRKKFVIVGYDRVEDAGRVYAYDISSGSTYNIETLNTTGGSAIINDTYPGLEYNPVVDRIVAWNGGDTVYSLNLDARTWTATTYPSGPGAPSVAGSGTHGRWRYSPQSGVFVLVNEYDQDVYIFRLTPNEISNPPTAPTALTIQ